MKKYTIYTSIFWVGVFLLNAFSWYSIGYRKALTKEQKNYQPNTSYGPGQVTVIYWQKGDPIYTIPDCQKVVLRRFDADSITVEYDGFKEEDYQLPTMLIMHRHER